MASSASVGFLRSALIGRIIYDGLRSVNTNLFVVNVVDVPTESGVRSQDGGKRQAAGRIRRGSEHVGNGIDSEQDPDAVNRQARRRQYRNQRDDAAARN